eukprot:g14932.t1
MIYSGATSFPTVGDPCKRFESCGSTCWSAENVRPMCPRWPSEQASQGAPRCISAKPYKYQNQYQKLLS